MESQQCAWWHYDDITTCAKYYLSLYPPAVLGSISFAVLLSKSFISYSKRSKKGYSLLQPEDSPESQPLLSANNEYGSTDYSNLSKEELKRLHFDIARLPETNIDGTPHGYRKSVYKDVWERLRVCMEYGLIIISLGLHLSPFVLNAIHREFKNQPLIPLVQSLFWLYLFIICTFRIINLKRVAIRLPNLWVHSTTLYFFTFFPSAITFRSALVNPRYSAQVREYYIIEFIINAILLYLNMTATVGDKPSQLYVTPGAEPSPENVSSIASFISYSWLNSMVWKSYKSPLKNVDIWALREDDYSLYILKGFEASKSTLKFTSKLFVHFKLLFAAQAFWAMLDSVLIFGPSLLLKKVLEYVADPEVFPKNLAWTFVLLMPLVKMSDSISSGCSLFLGRRVCVRMKAIIIGEVYAKALRRKITVTETTSEKGNVEDDKKTGEETDASSKTNGVKESKKTAELGAIINLMAIDAFKVSEACGYLHFFVSAILMIIICTVLLYGLLGWSALVGSFTIIVLLPVSFSLARWLGNLQKKMLGVTDKRIQKLNETFQSIRIVKFFAWESKFYENIMDIRKEEIYYLRFRCAVWCASAFVWFITPTLVTLFSFYCYTIIDGNTLEVPIAFTALSLFTLLRAPLDQLADMASLIIQSKVSLDRVADFLDEPETSKYDQLGNTPGPNDPYIGFQNATLSWNPQSKTDFQLRDMSIDFKVGKLNVIIGPTGCGKTSLLMGLLGEMQLLGGKIFLPGAIPRDDLVADPETGLTESIAYCSQSAWLLNDTIKNNITFGAHFNQERYDKVVDACGLTRDFQILSAGDETEVGEKGITLSGGQKQRVSLARALYSSSKHLLLDDCLSAVDSHTALWIYENCICGPLMEGRTCLLVSHNVALTVQNAAWVVALENGRVKNQGLPEDLLASGDLGDDDLVASSIASSRNQSSVNLQSLEDKNEKMKAKAAAIETKLKALGGEQEEVMAKTDGKLVEEEGKAEGVVGSEVYLGYAKLFGGFPVWSLLIFCFIASQGVYMYQTWWLKIWSTSSENLTQLAMASIGTSYDVSQLQQSTFVRTFSGVTRLFASSVATVTAYKETHTTLYYITIYGAIGIGYAFTASFRVFVVFNTGVNASNRMFEKVLQNILHAKLRFFDKTPLGRIMNRFSKDMEAVDQDLTPFAEGAFICIIQCLSTLVLITFITPGFLVFAVVISFLYYLVGFFYLSLSRELQRYDSITKSPIHQHFSESLAGVATIRAYGIESRFMKQNLKAIDQNSRPFFYLWVANRWLSFRVDAVGSMVMLFSGIFVLVSVGRIDAGLAGLSLSYAIAFSESALWVVRLYATVEMNMNSVERLQEFLKVEQEPPYEIKETEPRPTWPEEGRISVKDVSLRYAPELPRVIKNVSFEVEPCHKVGVVGRTGAGKSTIITAFFRFLDPETGSITIDGVEINSIGLKNLRQAITIIPQDPTLFVGTIRSNLDPFEQFTDVQMFEALRRVNLISPNEQPSSSNDANENQNKFFDLDNPITEGGGNLSQGERQLVCLARSLLKNPKVILLDEATSSIDYKSDALIQQTIREEFGNATILTIAHRLRTIIDYDKILVMDAGRVVEYDSPFVLLTNKDSLFYSMCENSGELDSLLKLAKESFIKKKNSQFRK
ncbi:YBT1 [[Candida] subhashii]|uniref:YBT1 n=1 Tax=[Candida] subhashii TaxID=561895 RepID=A0A8J5URV1_9ASCO|nr:YBT1 [[Candida] subhashii]KAG7664937.1 YBT1 [[Candida] subhashii]